MSRLRCLLTALLVLCALAPATAPGLVVTLRAPDSGVDLRNAYVRDAVVLALEKTRATDGVFQLQESALMNKSRALLEAARGEVPNFLITTGPETGRAAGLVPVLFPIHLGVNRYRVCFVHTPRQAAVRAAQSLAEVAQLRHVQGRGWTDVAVMRANGFAVAEVGAYESLFEMVAVGRADLFCRSVQEIGHEIRTHAGIKGLGVDDSLLLSYDLPQYLYTHAGNVAAIKRLERGLRLAFADGSLQALMRRYLEPSLALLDLPRRRLITLQTPGPSRVEMNDKPFQIDLMRAPQR